MSALLQARICELRQMPTMMRQKTTEACIAKLMHIDSVLRLSKAKRINSTLLVLIPKPLLYLHHSLMDTKVMIGD